MSAQTNESQVCWQDLKVMSELDLVLEIAKQAGWKDCEVFGSGDMLVQPQMSMGWELIPADLYKYSIPAEAIARLHQVINAGIRVKGVIIADDQHHEQPAPALASPKLSLPSVQTSVSWIGKALTGLIHVIRSVISFVGRLLLGLIYTVGAIVSFLGKALFGVICAIAVSAVIAFVAILLSRFGPVILLGLFVLPFIFSGLSSSYEYDPKLVILVDDGKGGTAWVSLFTWYD